jgi:hypothetical protein
MAILDVATVYVQGTLRIQLIWLSLVSACSFGSL